MFVFCDPIRRPTLAMKIGEIPQTIAVPTDNKTPAPPTGAPELNCGIDVLPEKPAHTIDSRPGFSTS